MEEEAVKGTLLEDFQDLAEDSDESSLVEKNEQIVIKQTKEKGADIHSQKLYCSEAL